MAVRDWLFMKKPKKEVLKAKAHKNNDAKRSYESDKTPAGYTPKTKKRSVEKQPAEISPAKKPPVEESPGEKSLDIPNILQKEFPLMATFQEGNFTENWEKAKKSCLKKELERVLERLGLGDVPKDVKYKYPTLAAFMPEILGCSV